MREEREAEESKGTKQQEETDFEKYYNLKILCSVALRVGSRIKHIDEECNLFHNKTTINEIKKGLVYFQNEIKLIEEVLLRFNQEPREELRKHSAALFEKTVILDEKLWESKVMESYSKLYMRDHLSDLSILFQEEDTLLLYEPSDLYDDTFSLIDSQESGATSELEIRKIVRDKNFELNKYMKRVKELDALMEEKNKRIKKLEKQTNKAILDQEESQKKDLKIQDLIKEIDQKEK